MFLIQNLDFVDLSIFLSLILNKVSTKFTIVKYS